MRLISYICVGLTITSFLFSSCGNSSKKGKDGRTDTYSSGTISFVSDESFSPIIEEEREVFQHDYPSAKVTPIYTNESDLKSVGILEDYSISNYEHDGYVNTVVLMTR